MEDLPLTSEAFAFMAERHAGHCPEGGLGAIPPPPPLELGALPPAFGYPERVVTAGLLHDILESSDTTAVGLRMRFGLVIAAWTRR